MMILPVMIREMVHTSLAPEPLKTLLLSWKLHRPLSLTDQDARDRRPRFRLSRGNLLLVLIVVVVVVVEGGERESELIPVGGLNNGDDCPCNTCIR
jgi:hypothetical protein